jgi:hypothetical protein
MAVREFVIDTTLVFNAESGVSLASLQSGVVTIDFDSMTVTAAQAELFLYLRGQLAPITVNFPVPTGRGADGILRLVSVFDLSDGGKASLEIDLPPGLSMDWPRHFRLGGNEQYQPADYEGTAVVFIEDQGVDVEGLSSMEPQPDPYVPPMVSLRRFFAGLAVDAAGDMPGLQSDDRARASLWAQQIAASCTHVELIQFPATQIPVWRHFEVFGRDEQWDQHCFLTDDRGRADAKQAEMAATLQEVQLVEY